MKKSSQQILKFNASFFLLLLPLFLVACTASINELKTKRDAGEATFVAYDHYWETVYAAITYVWHHSENSCIADHVSVRTTDYAIEEKAIYAKTSHNGSTSIGVFFEPLNNNWTEVAYVKAGFIKDYLHQCIIDGTIEEVSYLRKHGEEAYLEYTHKLFVQRLTAEQIKFTLEP
jgi:hypothetical protein